MPPPSPRAAATARRSTPWSTPPPTTSSGWAGAGPGFVCKLGDLVTKTRQGKDFIKLGEGAQARPPVKFSEGKFVAALSSDSRLLVFPLDEVPQRPNGGVGVQLLSLPTGISLASLAVTDGKSLVVSGIKRKNRAAATLDKKQLAGDR